MKWPGKRKRIAIALTGTAFLFLWWWTRPPLDSRFFGTWTVANANGPTQTTWMLHSNGQLEVRTGGGGLERKWHVENDHLIASHPSLKPHAPDFVVALYEKATGRFWFHQDPVVHEFRFLNADTVEMTELDGMKATFTLHRRSE